MNTVELYVKHGNGISDVLYDIKKSGAKYYPVNKINGGWKIEIENHPIVSYLILKFDLNTLN